MSEVITKKTCDKHGEYDSKSMKLFSKTIESKCPACHQEELEAIAEKEKKEQSAKDLKKWNDFLQASGMIKRYFNIKLDDITPDEDQKKAYAAATKFVDNFEDMQTKGQVLVFCGNVGTGKTMLTHALIQSLGFGSYLRAIDISRLVRDCYSTKESEYDLIDKLSSCPLLVIDEVGVQQGTANESMLITDLIDRRYGELNPTIICSNLNEKQLSEFFGERAWDRLMQNGAIIPITGKSKR